MTTGVYIAVSPRLGVCHISCALLTTYNAYHHASTLRAYIQQSYAMSIIKHVQGTMTFELEP